MNVLTFLKVSFDIEEIIKQVTILTREGIIIDIPLVLKDEDVLRGKWSRYMYDYFGTCFELSLTEVTLEGNLCSNLDNSQLPFF